MTFDKPILRTSEGSPSVPLRQAGTDGFFLPRTIGTAENKSCLREIPAVSTLRQIWAEPYDISLPGPPRFRSAKELPPASEQIVSAYDTEAQFTAKREISSVGYKVHITETCDPETPSLTVHVETTAATMPDENRLGVLHPKLAEKGVLPSTYLMDMGYTDAGILRGA